MAPLQPKHYWVDDPADPNYNRLVSSPYAGHGEAMWRAFANLEYQSADMTWLAWHPWLINLMTHFSVLWEISFCVLIWKPLWRPLMLAGDGEVALS